MDKIKAIRGMNDILPAQVVDWQHIEAVAGEQMANFGYQEIRVPIVEATALFRRGVGEATDIVEKEMYAFTDRNNDGIALRPEGTAGVVRACEEHGLLYNQTQRFCYKGPMFRYEKPQKGRSRQFHQIGLEAFGFNGPDIDAEVIAVSYAIFSALGLRDAVSLQLNSLGSNAARASYKTALVEYLSAYSNELDADSQRRLMTNPLRILDSKSRQTQVILESAPNFVDYMDTESSQHFAGVCDLLGALNIPFQHNPKIVRGLDYYNLTVFEWVSDKLGAQATVCGGGRYDGLVQQLGGKPCPAVGFGMGMERTVLLLEAMAVGAQAYAPDVYILGMGGDTTAYAMRAAQKIRSIGQQVVSHCGGGSFKSQMKKADKSGARWAIIIGEDEISKNSVTIKPLREELAQQLVSLDNVAAFFNETTQQIRG